MFHIGYRMLAFIAQGGSTKASGFSSKSETKSRFYGVFRLSHQGEAGGQWELRSEKSVLVAQSFMNWCVQGLNFLIGDIKPEKDVRVHALIDVRRFLLFIK